MKIEIYPDREMMAMDVANTLAGELEASLFHHETVTFAVPGGTTPGPIFDALCAADLEWSRIKVLLTDERWVPETHPRSNAALVKERLLVSRAARAEFIPFYRDGISADDAATEMSLLLRDMLPVSVLLLGMGEDMHTASLFPNAPDIDRHMSADASEVVAAKVPGQPEDRISLSAHVLDGALSKHLVIAGEAKRHALEMAVTRPAAEAPIGAVIDGGQVHWAE